MSQFVCFEMAEHNSDVTLENESSEGKNMSDIDVDFIDNTEYNESVDNVSREYDDAIEDSFAGFDFS